MGVFPLTMHAIPHSLSSEHLSAGNMGPDDMSTTYSKVFHDIPEDLPRERQMSGDLQCRMPPRTV
jgi:hypothetical protein